ncbi:hypothetical protein J7443_24440 [Tropicibacter sp. R15_0]|uniref:hypothetical protein n=1 Tax=Tropicibacter sp. R15_0 TaxID=2821101 RepID=UPI001ADBA300|nr:hypothetical protein [Tropicibacter sp. R15_0]MBO9468395.1 hypothetical protein [Tropicibacter sp. R15_0]
MVHEEKTTKSGRAGPDGTATEQLLPQKEEQIVPLKHADDPQCAYLLQEVSIFNNRVVWYLEQQQKQEVFALGASGALWAYILQQSQSPYVLLLVAIPFSISAVLALKSRVLTQAMQESMSYLAALEERFELESDMGWVHFYRSNTSHYKKRWRRAFWSVLIVVNLGLAIGFLTWPQQDNVAEDNVVAEPQITAEETVVVAPESVPEGSVEETDVEPVPDN